jgi:hypothetical protein
VLIFVPISRDFSGEKENFELSKIETDDTYTLLFVGGGVCHLLLLSFRLRNNNFEFFL